MPTGNADLRWEVLNLHESSGESSGVFLFEGCGVSPPSDETLPEDGNSRLGYIEPSSLNTLFSSQALP